MGKEEIAYKLRQARIKSKKTQKEVADLLGMTYQAISNYERGKTKVESDILIKLCDIYKISVRDVLSNRETNETQQDNTENTNYLNTDYQLQKIVDCYNHMDEIGRSSLMEQAEFLLSKHKKIKEKSA